MKVLLTTLNAKFIHSSLALAYLQAFGQGEEWWLEKQEYTINERNADIMADIYERQPDVLCFSVYIWNVESILDICRDFKKVAPETLIVLGGPEVSYDAQQVLEDNPAIDVIIRGEGEVTFRELLTGLAQKLPLTDIKGLTYRINGDIFTNSERELIHDLDIIPFPYPTNLDYYHNRVIYYESSRGCPFNCSYCLSSTIRGVRFFSMERVKKDLLFFMEAEVREVKFVDRTFNCHEKWAIEIMRFIIEHNRSTKFHLEICADLLSEEMLAFLKEVPAGIFDFEIGIQSTYVPALSAVNRTMNWEKLKNNIAFIRDSGNIHLHLDLIAGLPYEDYKQFQKSFNDVYALQPHVIQLGFLKLLKGSQIRAESVDYGYEFFAKAPYQVLLNRFMSYAELNMLTAIEDMLDRYYNSGNFKLSMDYITGNIYGGDAFAFFAALALYWQKKNPHGMSYKKEKEYALLKAFMDAAFPDYKMQINELLKIDFLCNFRIWQLPEGLESFNPPDNNERLYEYLKDADFITQKIPAWSGQATREMRRNAHLEQLGYDPIANKFLPEPAPFLFIYDPTSKKAAQILALG